MGCHKLTYHENFPELKVEQGKDFACEKTGVRVLYFGARYYNSDISVWLSVDPLADEYPSLSAYMYTAGNPVMLVDPDGMRIDDYFNRLGEFLGSDDAETDNVRIISQKKWDDNKSVNKDDSETIDHKVGVENSDLHSESGISDDAS